MYETGPSICIFFLFKLAFSLTKGCKANQLLLLKMSDEDGRWSFKSWRNKFLGWYYGTDLSGDGLQHHNSRKNKHHPEYVPKHATIVRFPTGAGAGASSGHHVFPQDEEPRRAVVKEKENNLDTLGKHAWAGAVAGIIADTLMHPFDTISTRLKVQVSKQGETLKYNGLIGTTRVLVAEEGIRSLFYGVSATVLCAVPSSAIYFGVYEAMKTSGLKLVDQESDHQVDGVHLMAGIVAELGASVVVVPFEVVKSRLQMGGSPYHGAMNGIYTIAKTEGLSGLYAGYRACLFLDCTFSGLQFLIYERMRKDIKSNRHDSGSSGNNNNNTSYMNEIMEDTAEDFVAGAISGGLAAFLSNPMDVVAARLMTQHSGGSYFYKGTMDSLISIAKEEGARGLWSGSLARVLSIVPLSGLTFTIYEKMKLFLFDEGEGYNFDN